MNCCARNYFNCRQVHWIAAVAVVEIIIIIIKIEFRNIQIETHSLSPYLSAQFKWIDVST